MFETEIALVMKQIEDKKRRDFRLRVTIVFFSVVVSILVWRLLWVQIIDFRNYSSKASYQQYRDVEVLPKRGNIYDRNGKELAVSISSYDVYVEFIYAKTYDKKAKQEKKWGDKEWESFAHNVGGILGEDSNKILEKVKQNQDKSRFILTKKIDYAQKMELEKLHYKALFYEENTRRLYPYGKFASYILGHTSKDNVGLGGIEAYFNKELSGIPGRKIVLTDAKARELEDHSIQYHEPVNGYHVISTIDEVIQHYVEKAMEQSYIENNSQRSMAIVIDPKTGDILAMAAKPDYNPETPNELYYYRFREAMSKAKTNEEQVEVLNSMWRNPMVSDLYEPGSVFKVVTASAGIEEGVVAPNSTFVDRGYVEVAGKKLSNWSKIPFGTIDFRKAVGQSVNTVFVEVAKRLETEKFLEYVYAFGFGKKTGISLPGEAEGIIYSLDKLGPVQRATMSFGQSISVTPIQMVMAVSAVANNGELMKPRLVREVISDNGEIIQRFEPEVVRRTTSKTTNDTMLDLLENVVKREGGKKAAIFGYRVAGKSGTAQKVVNGKYPKGYYISSFVGIAPVEDPKVVVLVITDEPRGQRGFYGGGNSAPFVGMILQDTLRYMGVTPNAIVSNNTNIEKVDIPEVRNMTFKEARVLLNASSLKYTTDVDSVKDDTLVVDMFPKPGEVVPIGSSIVLYFEGKKMDEVLMPNLIGKTVSESQKIVNSLGLRFNFSGNGKAIKQFPEPNKLVKKGSMVNIKFEDSSSVKPSYGQKSGVSETEETPMEQNKNTEKNISETDNNSDRNITEDTEENMPSIMRMKH